MSRVPVLIKVLDVNDNAPEFAMYYETFVCENVKAGQVELHSFISNIPFICCSPENVNETNTISLPFFF